MALPLNNENMDTEKSNFNAVQLKNIQVEFEDTKVLKDLTFDLKAGEILCLLGPSGCGKTTALKTIAGLISPNKGEINLFGVPVFSSIEHQHKIDIPAEQRSIGFIFQDYALFPHMTVRENIAYGLSHLSKQEKQQRIEEALLLVELPNLQARYPHELSGGQQQRIAVARALAPKPKLLLMDEPFSNIDGQVKRRMMADLRKLLKKNQVSCIFVTHAKEEAFAFADKTAVMASGNIEQLDTPAFVFNNPKNVSVARFMESGNIAPVNIANEIFNNHFENCSADNLKKTSGSWLLKPEHLVMNKSDSSTGIKLVDCIYIGRGYQYEVSIQLSTKDTSDNNTEVISWKVESDLDLDLEVGDRLSLEYNQLPHWMPN